MKKNSIPAIPFMKAIRQWAISTGRPFFTLRQQLKAKAAYINFQSQLN
jgi:hypothetical protein